MPDLQFLNDAGESDPVMIDSSVSTAMETRSLGCVLVRNCQLSHW